jgi:hypothetical protein
LARGYCFNAVSREKETVQIIKTSGIWKICLMDVTPPEKRRRRKPRSRNNVTVLQVAKHAGVSTATVSRCLSNPDIVRAALRAKVEAAIEELGYTPDLAARFLGIGRINTLFTQVQQLMTAVEPPGNCVTPPRIWPLWSQGR